MSIAAASSSETSDWSREEEPSAAAKLADASIAVSQPLEEEWPLGSC